MEWFDLLLVPVVLGAGAVFVNWAVQRRQSQIAREENRGDPTRRLRDLRALGWTIVASRKKSGKRTVSFYCLKQHLEWPPEGPGAKVAEMEAARRARKKSRP